MDITFYYVLLSFSLHVCITFWESGTHSIFFLFLLFKLRSVSILILHHSFFMLLFSFHIQCRISVFSIGVCFSTLLTNFDLFPFLIAKTHGLIFH